MPIRIGITPNPRVEMVELIQKPMKQTLGPAIPQLTERYDLDLEWGKTMKVYFFIGILILLAGCSWPKVKVGPNEYYLSPFPPNQTINLPHSTGGSGAGSGSSGVQGPEPSEQK